MNLIRTNDYDDMSRKAANIISAQVILKPNSVLGLATGSSPVGVYRQLVDWYQKGDLDFSGVSTVNLDEYRGLPYENAQSYHYFMHRHLFDHINLSPENILIPDGMENDAHKACADYERKILSLGGIDLQLLGLGHNGHIGFNEPADVFPKQTHCVDLTESTIRANQRFFEAKEQVPKQAYTMGIGTIMAAKKILIVVSGKDKAEILRKVFWDEITPAAPASILQLHPDVTIVADEQSLSRWPQ